MDEGRWEQECEREVGMMESWVCENDSLPQKKGKSKKNRIVDY